MLLGPRAFVRSRRVNGIRGLVAQLCRCGRRIFVKELSVVVDRRCQLFVSVIQLQTAFPLRLEIQAPLDALWANLADGQGRIVSIVDVHRQTSRVVREDIGGEVLVESGGATPVYAHAADVPGS